MNESSGVCLARRGILTGAAAAGGLLVLPGCASIERHSYVAAVRRILTLATRDAFDRLTAPGGFWDSEVARIELPVLFGKSGKAMKGVLRSDLFREQLQKRLNTIAEKGAKQVAPIVADAVRKVGIDNATAILKGGKTAATTYLRAEMGPALVNAMIPEFDQVMRAAHDPLLNQAISALAGVTITDAAHALALGADNAIWFEIGAAEARIRENPQATHDPAIIAALKKA